MKPVMGDFDSRLDELNLNRETMFGLDIQSEIIKSFADEYISSLDLTCKSNEDTHRMLAYINDLEISFDTVNDTVLGIRVLRAIMKAAQILD